MTNNNKAEKKALVESDHGITRESIAFFEKNRNKVGKVLEVRISRHKEKCDYITLVIGTDLDLQMSGFSFGYRGEGPGGLRWLLDQLNIPYAEKSCRGESVYAGLEPDEEGYEQRHWFPDGVMKCDFCGVYAIRDEKEDIIKENIIKEKKDEVWEAYRCMDCNELSYNVID